MDISVLVSFKTKLVPHGWSASFCPCCQQLEAVRLNETVLVVAVWFVPIYRTVTGKAAQCDFCERFIDPNQIASERVSLDEWAPADGLETLFRRLAPQKEFAVPEQNSDGRLHSLLAAAGEAASIHEMDITFGMTTGALAGVAVSVPVGLYLFHNKLLRMRTDEFGVIFGSILIGIFAGIFLGAIVHAILKRGKAAFAKLETTSRRYDLDLDRLEVLSHEHGGLVQRSARALRDAKYRETGASL